MVEDSRFFGSVLRSRLENDLGLQVRWAETCAQARAALEEADEPFGLALLDLVLPDATNGEVVDLVQSRGVPVIVLTGQISDELRDRMWSKRVVDYVLKDGPGAIDYALELVRRFEVNPEIKVLVVDDSRVALHHVQSLLEVHGYQIFAVSSPSEALVCLEQHPDIRLAIVDFNMPEMDGEELTRRIRRTRSREALAVIGISTYGSGHLSARFLKSGANDFLYKPFVSEEFYCRIAENLKAQDHLRALEKAAFQDYLTGLYNRRYFFEVTRKLLAVAHRSERPLAVAMIDIDHFKGFNDTYGHDVGDEVLREVAQALAGLVRGSDVVARLGGEEFCVVATNTPAADARGLFEALRQAVSARRIPHESGSLSVTVSVGVSTTLEPEIDQMLAAADRLLYEAKEGGRNRVVCDHDGQDEGGTGWKPGGERATRSA